MTRRTPLKRKARLRQKRARPRRSGRARDRDYLLRVKGLPCWFAKPLLFGFTWTNYGTPEQVVQAVYEQYECSGSAEADHAGPRPLGRKADDTTAIPLCPWHHRARTDYSGYFHGWNAQQMREWCDQRIAETRAALNWSATA